MENNTEILEEAVDMVNENAPDEIIETDEHIVNMILADRVRIRCDGTVRPGIKVPIASASTAQKALYEKLVAQGLDFDTIGNEMAKLNNGKNVLRPINIDYFVVRDSDFRNPAHAQYIRDNFTDADGKIRRIPIIFSSNDITAAIPHSYTAFNKAHEIRCFSFYDGAILKFKYLDPSFRGIAKQTDWKILDSDDIDKATEACGLKVSFGGRYQFSVPGVATMGAISLPTGSWYGLGDAVAVLRQLQSREMLGRFNGTLNGKHFLELVKIQQDVKTPEGKKQKQWVVTINTSVDMETIFAYAEERLDKGRLAFHALNGGGRKSHSLIEPPKPSQVREQVVTPSVQTPVSAPVENKKNEEKSQPAPKPAATNPAKNASKAPAQQPTPTKAAEGSNDERTKIFDSLKGLVAKAGLSGEEFNAYAEFKLRQPIKAVEDLDILKRLFGEMAMRIEKDATAFKAKCKELVTATKPAASSASTSNDPEVEGMWEEFRRLADRHDLIHEHLQAHLLVLTNTEPEKMTLEVLQNAYKEIEGRLKRDADSFIEECRRNHDTLLKAA